MHTGAFDGVVETAFGVCFFCVAFTRYDGQGRLSFSSSAHCGSFGVVVDVVVFRQVRYHVVEADVY